MSDESKTPLTDAVSIPKEQICSFSGASAMAYYVPAAECEKIEKMLQKEQARLDWLQDDNYSNCFPWFQDTDSIRDAIDTAILAEKKGGE